MTDLIDDAKRIIELGSKLHRKGTMDKPLFRLARAVIAADAMFSTPLIFNWQSPEFQKTETEWRRAIGWDE